MLIAKEKAELAEPALPSQGHLQVVLGGSSVGPPAPLSPRCPGTHQHLPSDLGGDPRPSDVLVEVD